MNVLTDAARKTALQGPDGWAEVIGLNAIRKTLKFRDFTDAWGFMTRVAIAAQAMESLRQIFSDDIRAQQIIAGLFEEWSPEEICGRYAISKTDYDSTRRRMRRALVHAGLRLPQP